MFMPSDPWPARCPCQAHVPCGHGTPRRHRLASASAHTTGQRDTHMIAASQRGFRPANRLIVRSRLP
jgi:hypothetical protein